MRTPFIGSEAVASGEVRKHELRSKQYVALFPDVYTRRGTELTILHRATAAWLWSHREGVIAGLTASALHGAKYVGSTLPIEMIWSNRRPPPGIDIHSARNLGTDEIARHYGLALTSVERTAFDIGRRDELDDAVARLDALGNATRLHVDGVRAMARERHRGARGVRQLLTALDLHDPGAESPRETWLRLLLVRAGYPPPETQIQVLSPDRSRRYYLDMGWEDLALAVEYDGDHHRTDPVQFAHDIVRSEDLDELRWTRVRVTKRHEEADVLQRVARAWASVRSDRRIA